MIKKRISRNGLCVYLVEILCISRLDLIDTLVEINHNRNQLNFLNNHHTVQLGLAFALPQGKVPHKVGIHQLDQRGKSLRFRKIPWFFVLIVKGRGCLLPRIVLSGGSHCKQLLSLDSIVYKTTHGLLLRDDAAQLSHKLLNILHTVGIITTTVEGDGHFTILHIRDVFDGAGSKSELRHNEFKNE